MFDIIRCDLGSAEHGAAVVELLDSYACSLMGGGVGLSTFAKSNLVSELVCRTNCYIILAFEDAVAAGVVVCFEAFSTFACRPLLNVHDVVVAEPFRGRGLSKLMFAKVEEHAIAIGCCKITLEVLQHNEVAKNLYSKLGFAAYELDPALGTAMFWQKLLGANSEKGS